MSKATQAQMMGAMIIIKEMFVALEMELTEDDVYEFLTEDQAKFMLTGFFLGRGMPMEEFNSITDTWIEGKEREFAKQLIKEVG